VLSSALGPIVFKIALEQQNIKEIFELLHKLFACMCVVLFALPSRRLICGVVVWCGVALVFDVNASGSIDKSEIQKLIDCDLMDEVRRFPPHLTSSLPSPFHLSLMVYAVARFALCCVVARSASTAEMGHKQRQCHQLHRVRACLQPPVLCCAVLCRVLCCAVRC
jgi:hypothetical protein